VNAVMEILAQVKCGEYLEQLRNYKLLGEDSAPWPAANAYCISNIFSFTCHQTKFLATCVPACHKCQQCHNEHLHGCQYSVTRRTNSNEADTALRCIPYSHSSESDLEM